MHLLISGQAKVLDTTVVTGNAGEFGRVKGLRVETWRGLYARSLWDGPDGLRVRSGLIKGEIDDLFGARPVSSQMKPPCDRRPKNEAQVFLEESEPTY